MRLLRTAAALAAAAAALGTGIGPAAGEVAEKVPVCHGTASLTNPYVEVHVSANSFKDGHFDDGTAISHGENNFPDFVLATGRTCADGPGGGGGGGGAG